MNTKSTITIVVMTVVTVLIIFAALRFNPTTETNRITTTEDAQVLSYEGKQIIELLAKAGYSPSKVNAAANTETILRVNTDNTFDCSSSLTIPKLGIRKNLPPTAATDIPIPSQLAGTVLAGTCSMGMYNFNLYFN